MININEIINERYKILNVLGHGGMSDVYEARDIIFKRNVAIKLIKTEFSDKAENLIRFENEARFSSAINHPNIIKIYDYNTYKGLPYIVNEYVRGQTLRDVLDFKRRLTVKESCRIMIQLCDALIFIHSKNIIHRDIKPNNIFYNASGDIKLGDFGISYLINSSYNINENKKVMGTAQYLAPEIIRGKTPTFQSDIYSLGITFYELITGRVPFDGENPTEIARMQVNLSIASPLTIIPDLPKEVETIIKKATSKDLYERYQNVSILKQDFINLYNNKKAMKKGRSFISRLFGFAID